MTAAPGSTGRSRSGRLLLAGIGVAGAGVALAIAGVIVAPLFLPGAWIITAGTIVLAAAGIAGIAEARGVA